MKKHSLILCFLVMGLFGRSLAQISVEGKVVDAKTAQPIPFLSIGLKNASLGTLTNENGEFILKVSELPAVIITSHIGYKSVEMTLTKATGNEIKLAEATHNLPEVRVSNLAEKLIKQAVQKNYDNRKQSVYSNAFYRQTTQTGDEYSELQEIFYATKTSSISIEGVRMKQARYAKIRSAPENPTFTFTNLAYMAWGLSLKAQESKPEPNKFIVACRADVADFFDLSINDIITDADQEIYEISCTPKAANPPAVYFSGSVFINRKTSNVVKITGQLLGDFVGSSNMTDTKLLFDCNFRELPTGLSVLQGGNLTNQRGFR